MRSPAKPRFLMCAPKYFAVTYAINPWMDPIEWARDAKKLAAKSRRQWDRLRQSLIACGAKVELVPPRRGMPDMVFTANSAVVLDGKALLARFRHPQRQLEQPAFANAFRALEARGIIDDVRELQRGLVLEGAGDCIWDPSRSLFWMGYGQRSDLAVRSKVEEVFGVEVMAIELVDPRFYHLDTAMCALSGGEVIYLPSAFSPTSRDAFESRVAPHARIAVSAEDAGQLAANAVCIDDTLLLSGCSNRLRAQLQERGYRVVATPLSSFLRSGGAAFCLTLRLDWCLEPAAARVDDAAAA
jgi:N-dimethylarginine dimethylaminohydrolase